MKCFFSLLFVFTIPLSLNAQHTEASEQASQNYSLHGSAAVSVFSEDVSQTGTSLFALYEPERLAFSPAVAVAGTERSPFPLSLRTNVLMRLLPADERAAVQSFSKAALFSDFAEMNAGVSPAEQFRLSPHASNSNRRNSYHLLPPSAQIRRDMHAPPTNFDHLLRGTMGLIEVIRGN